LLIIFKILTKLFSSVFSKILAKSFFSCINNKSIIIYSEHCKISNVKRCSGFWSSIHYDKRFE